MLLAQIDANGWAIILGAFFVGLNQIVSMILAYYREQAKIAREAVVEKKVDAIKVTTGEVLKATEEVHKATNSLVEKRVEITGTAEFAKGKLEGQVEILAGRATTSAAAVEDRASQLAEGVVAKAGMAVEVIVTKAEIAAEALVAKAELAARKLVLEAAAQADKILAIASEAAKEIKP